MKIKPTIFIDWDETITIKDTIQILSQIPYRKNPNFTPKFQYFQNLYFEKFLQYQQSKNRDNLDQEFQFQNGLKSVEYSSIGEINRVKLFKNLKIDDFTINIPLKPGFIEFARKCNQNQIPLIILSVNWTSLIMKYVMEINNIHISHYLTNEFEFNNDKTTGNWLNQPKIHTGIDKLNYFNTWKSQNPSPTVYIGDSSTDLFCLLNATIGIVIENGSILSTLNRLKIPYGPLSTNFSKIIAVEANENGFPHLSTNSTANTFSNPVPQSQLFQGNWHDIQKFVFEQEN